MAGRRDEGAPVPAGATTKHGGGARTGLLSRATENEGIKLPTLTRRASLTRWGQWTEGRWPEAACRRGERAEAVLWEMDGSTGEERCGREIERRSGMFHKQW